VFHNHEAIFLTDAQTDLTDRVHNIFYFVRENSLQDNTTDVDKSSKL